MNKLISIIAVGLFFGVIYGYACETVYFTNTLNVFYLLSRAAVGGVLLGLIVFSFYKKNVDEGIERFQLGAFFALIGIVVLPYVAIFTNHFFAKSDPLSIKVIFQRDEAIRTGRFGISKGKLPEVDGVYTYFLKNLDLDRVRSKQPLFRGIESGTEVELPIKKGFWGYQFVDIK